MRKTSILQKFAASVINATVVLLAFLPFYIYIENILYKKLILIGLFLLYNLIFLAFNNSRCLGMILMETYYDKRYPKINQLLYILLYTASFSTLLFWFYFPFDLFLLNVVILQIPTILINGTTIHGYISGNIKTVTK